MLALFQYLYAETLALPFYHEKAFFKALFRPEELINKDDYIVFERDLLKLVPGISVDHLYNLRDQVWFQSASDGQNSLYHILHSHANQYLNNTGAVAYPHFSVPTEWGATTPAEVWRWLCFAMPPDLLLAAGWGLDGPLQISWETPLLGAHLQEHGIAQTHVHLGAASDFSVHWCQVQNALATISKSDQLQDKGAPFREGKDFLAWLTAAAIARILLCEFVLKRESDRDSLTLAAYFESARDQIAKRISAGAAVDYFIAIQTLCSPHNFELPSHSALQKLYARLIRFVPQILTLENIWLLDPLVRNYPLPVNGSQHEIYWLRKAFEYLQSPTGQNDEFFQKLLWQTIRLKVMYYRYIVQRPMVKGLSWFIQFYRRISKLTVHQFTLENAFLIEGGNRHLLKSYEFRMGPKSTFTSFRSLLTHFLDEWVNMNGRNHAELGCVIHIPKSRGPEFKSKKPGHHWLDSFFNPENNPLQFRLGKYFKTKQKEVKVFCRMLRDIPLSMAFLRGIDMCTDEVGVPNWFMAHLLKPIFEAGQDAFRLVSQKYPQWKKYFKPLKRTMHVGEDFQHLMDGVRRMDEVITRFPLERGDRIGHGLALGHSPKRWVQQNPIIWMPKEIRLWDLIWEWKQYQIGAIETSVSRLEKIRNQVENYSRDIFGNECTATDTRQLYEDLFDSEKLNKVGFPTGQNQIAGLDQLSAANRDLYWLYAYLTDSRIFRQSYQVIEVHNTQDELNALFSMQRVVRKRVCEKDITIEVNPSSNFLIADLQNLEHHPLWNLNPPPGHQSEEDMGAPINICIGSDDPITFATNLPQEYELLYNVLLQKGVGGTGARQWLDQVRQTGLNARFTLTFGPENRDADQVWMQLLKDLKADWKRSGE